MDLPRRWAGVLLHPTSLPGPGATGTLGIQAHRFVDRIADLGFRAWQVLPLCPPGAGHSPYASWSSMMGAPELIDLPMLADAGLLSDSEALPGSSGERVDPALVDGWHRPMIRTAADRLLARPDHPLHAHLAPWIRRHRGWLVEAVRYAARKEAAGGGPWWAWPEPLRSRDLDVLTRTDAQLAHAMRRWEVIAFLFDQQWAALRRRAVHRGVALVGDVPIYVSEDSADCWSRPDLFEVDRDGRAAVVSGCPPDAFNPDGQRWGHPMYRWEVHAADGFRWWIARVRRALELVHRVRIDHFRGFSAGWAIPAAAPDARAGRWVPAPGEALFAVLRAELGGLPMIAEDLGHIDDDVRALLHGTGMPGTRVLQFGFDGDPDNPHHPDRIPRHAIVYTGTHDNPTAVGWFDALPADQRYRVRRQLGCDRDTVADSLVASALDCAARGAVIPLQDLLGLDDRARMNTPGTAEGNWLWRVTEGQLAALDDRWAARLRDADRA